MVNSSELIISVVQSYSNLLQLLDKLSQNIFSDEKLIAWVQEENYPIFNHGTQRHRERAIALYQQNEYLNEQAPREILVCAGFIGSSENTIKNAIEVNLAKESFKKSIINLRKANISHKEEWLNELFENSLHSRSKETHQTLKSTGLSRLHLKQCYRKIPILHHAPSKITWTWAHTRSIKRILAKDALQLLLKKGQQPRISMQINKLSQIPQSEILAIVQDLAPHLRTNLVFKNENSIERKMVKGPVPILFPANDATPFPEFKPPSEKQLKDKERLIRSDVKIEPEPFLPSIRAHRYRNLET